MTSAKSATKSAFKSLPKLTRKQALFVKELKENPKQSATQAALKAYDNTSYMTAAQIASENLKKPQIISHLADYNDMVENTLSNAIYKFKNSDDVKELTLAVDTAKYVHDKIHGKAVTKNLNLNATVSIEDMLNELQ